MEDAEVQGCLLDFDIVSFRALDSSLGLSD